MSAPETLLPCPWCGSTDVEVGLPILVKYGMPNQRLVCQTKLELQVGQAKRDTPSSTATPPAEELLAWGKPAAHCASK